jgi:hypothetical protein
VQPADVSGDYSEMLSSSVFCLVVPGDGWSARMEDAMLHGWGGGRGGRRPWVGRRPSMGRRPGGGGGAGMAAIDGAAARVEGHQ